MEGYTKYECAWIREPLLTGSVSADLNRLRCQMREYGYIGMILGTDIGFGNVSERSTDGGFIVSGTQTGHIENLTDDDYSWVQSWDYETNSLVCIGCRQASSESLSHAAIYDTLPVVKFVAHIHSKTLWTKSLGTMPTTPEYAEFGTVALAKEIGKLCIAEGFAGAIALGGHEDGLIFCGQTVDDIIKMVDVCRWRLPLF